VCVAQSAEAADLKSAGWKFESSHAYLHEDVGKRLSRLTFIQEITGSIPVVLIKFWRMRKVITISPLQIYGDIAQLEERRR
jgi:hypothetical protein